MSLHLLSQCYVINYIIQSLVTCVLDACFFFFFLLFLGPHPWHMEAPRLGVSSELQLPAYATATAMPDLSCICDLHHSSRQCQILNPLSKARDGTRNLMVTSRICFCWATTGTPTLIFLKHMSHPFYQMFLGLGLLAISSWLDSGYAYLMGIGRSNAVSSVHPLTRCMIPS